MIIEEVEFLKQWLVTQLEMISEADPSVLAKYVIALLKKDEAFNEDTFVEQLEVFLDKETESFVKNLYDVIESKEYMPVPPKKKRVFTEVKEVKAKDDPKPERKISIDTKKGTEQRLVELSIDVNTDEDDKMNARKRRFEEDRDRRKRGSRPGGREEETRRFNTESYEERRDVRRFTDRGDRTRSDEQAPRDRYPASRDITRDRGDITRDRVGYPKRRYTPDRHQSRSPSPPKRSRSPPTRRSRSPVRQPRSPRKKSNSPPRNGKARKERCRDFDEKGYCLRGGLCQYDHGIDPVVVEESSLSSVLQAAQTPSLPPPPPGPFSGAPPLFPPGETYNPDKPALINNQTPLVPAPAQPLPPPRPVTHASSTSAPSAQMSETTHPSKPYVHTVKRAPSSTGVPRSFKLVDGSNIITGAVVPVEPTQTTLLVRDIPYQSNDSALLSHHLGKYGPIKQLQCRVYNDVHTAMVEFHSHDSAAACFNSNIALLGVRYIKFFWKEVVPISLAPSLFKNMGKVTTSSIHQDMNLVNNKTSAPPPPAALSLVTNNKPATTPREQPRPTAAQKKLELAKRTQGLLAQNVVNQKLILSKLESCKVLSEKRSMLETMKKLQLSHDTIKASLASIENSDRKRKAPQPVKQAPATTLGASTNLDLRPKEIIVKNCNNAEELHEHFSKFGTCTVIPSGVGVIIGFDKRRDAEMAYVKGRIVDDQELDIEWNKTGEVTSSQVTVEPIR
ncbi:RNA-binding protein 26-like [Bolinopsis microptera]|uniref:RNA-binding protein 26-like n=1 Tax=Bolinopsis microptera TaxID=2820187 RepID=UPI003079174E